MAIETTYFTPVIGANNWKEFSDWMFANATEYFSEFVLDTTVTNTSTYMCKKDNAYIIFERKYGNVHSTDINIGLQNGITHRFNMSSISGTSIYTTSLFISRTIKTNSGIIIAVSDKNSPTVYYDILCISKTNTGNTGIIVTNSNSSSETDVYSISLADSKAFTGYSIITPAVYVGASAITSFCNVPCIGNSTEYFPNVFITPFYKYKTGTIVDNDNIKYIFMGGKAANYLVLKD